MMRNKAHELGITDAQLSGLAEADQAYFEAATQGAVDDKAVSAADAEKQLRTEWGAAFDLKVAGIDVAAHKLGMSDEQLTGLRESMGPVEAMKFVDGLNTKIGDHNFEDGIPVTPGHKTPEQAKAELADLSMNKEFQDAWLNKQHPGHTAAVEKKAALARLMEALKLASQLEGVTSDNVLAVAEILAQYIEEGPKVVELTTPPRQTRKKHKT